jgi:hypothetical protein
LKDNRIVLWSALTLSYDCAQQHRARSASMILFAVIMIACGAVLGRSFQPFVLVPASVSVWGLALAFTWAHNFSFMQSLVAAMLFASCLQFGYLLGAAVTDLGKARRRSRRLIATL